MDTHLPPLSAAVPPSSPMRDKRDKILQLFNKKLQSKQLTTKKDSNRQPGSSMSTVPALSPERTTATSTKEACEQRYSQAKAASDEQQNMYCDEQTMERECSNEDDRSVELLYGYTPLTQPEVEDKIIRNEQQENEHHCYRDAASESTMGPKASSSLVSSAEKGTGAMSDGHFATITRDQSTIVTGPSERPKIAQAVVAGAVVVTVASGVAVCQLSPSSPAATWIIFAANEVELFVRSLFAECLNNVCLFVKYLCEEVQTAWLVLLRKEQMENGARALTFMVNEKLRSQLTVVAKMKSNFLHQFVAAFSYSMVTVEWWMKWVQSLVLIVYTSIEFKLCGNHGVLNRMQSVVVTTFLSLAELSNQVTEWMQSSLEHVMAWTGLASNVSDMSLLNDESLALLETNEKTIETIKKELTAHEFQALQDIERFEKRRATIAFDTNAILTETRDFALKSIGSIKMAAFEAVKYRMMQLKEQYARSLDQALQHYEWTSRQLESEGEAAMVAGIAQENQAHVYAAAALKRALTRNEKSEDGEQVKVTTSEDDDRASVESWRECFTDDQCLDNERELLAHKDEFDSSGLIKQDGEDITGLGFNEEIRVGTRLAIERHMTDELSEVPIVERSSFEKALGREQKQEPGQLTTKLLLSVEFDQSALEDASVGDLSKENVRHFSEHSRDEMVTMDLDSVNKEMVAGKINETAVVGVSRDLNNAELKAKHYQMEIPEVRDSYSPLDDVEEIQQEGHVTSSIDVANDQTELKLDAEIGESGNDQLEARGALFDVRTHVAGRSKIEKNGEHISESTSAEDYVQTLDADDKEMKVNVDQTDTGIALKATMHSSKADALAATIQGVQVVGVLDMHTHNEAAADEETMDRDDRAVGEPLRDDLLLQDARAQVYKELETVEHETAAVAKEVSELKQLEQSLLQKISERAWVEKELRTIAEEEEIWLETTQTFGPSQQTAVTETRSTATMDVRGPAEVEAHLSKETSQTSVLPVRALAQLGLLSVVFLGLAALATYLLVQRRTTRVFGRPRPRRKRWHSLAAVNEAEEVVLLSDDDLDDEDLSDAPVSVVERSPSVEKKATTPIFSSGDEKIDYEEDTFDKNEVVDKDEEYVKEESDIEPVILETAAERTTTTYMTDSTATPSSDASSDKSTISVSTPPVSSPETPRISQRTRQRRRQIHL